MGHSKITTPEGFREAVEEFDRDLDELSADAAATRADRILGATPKAAKATPKDDLDDILLLVEAIKGRVRRKWKKQRSRNMRGTAGGTLLAGAVVWLTAEGAKVGAAPWLLPALIVLGVLVGIVCATALADSSDWRDDVGKPIEEAAAHIAEELAEGVERKSPYRSRPEELARDHNPSPGKEPESLRNQPTPETPARGPARPLTNVRAEPSTPEQAGPIIHPEDEMEVSKRKDDPGRGQR